MSVGVYTDMDDMYDFGNVTNATSVAPTTYVPIIGAVSIFTGVLLVLLSIVTVAGNIGTIWAFRSNILLRQKPSNLLILSLSCCDLAVGASGLPVAAVHTGLGYWPLGKPVCIISAFFSVIGVSAAMYTVTAISIDRWLLVSREYPSYLRIQSSRNVKLQIAGAWIAAILISSCETILWVVQSFSNESMAEGTIDYSLQCISPVRSDPIFTLVIFALLFAIPFLVMVISTMRFVVLLRRRLRKSRKRRNMSIVSSINVVANIKREPSATSSVDNSVYDNKAFDDPSKKPTTSEKPKESSQVSVTFDKKTQSTDTTTAVTRKPVKHQSLGQTGRGKSFFGLGSDASLGASTTKGRRAIKMKNRYMKPAIRLAILLGVFALCTLPYPIFIILADETLEGPRNHLSNLLLSNSGLNPFLYAIMHRKIRLFYINKLTLPCCRKRNM